MNKTSEYEMILHAKMDRKRGIGFFFARDFVVEKIDFESGRGTCAF